MDPQYFQPLLGLLGEKFKEDLGSPPLESDTLRWLAENAWNLGLRAAKSLQFLTAANAMQNSFDLFSMIPNADEEIEKHKKRCLLVAAGAQLEAALVADQVFF